MTAKALAGRAALSPRFVSQVERGKANPSLGTMHDLANALGVDVRTLLSDAGPRDRLHRAIDVLDNAAVERTLAWLSRARPKTVALLGLRGAGKSTLGPRIAGALGRKFVEVNREIESEAGLSLAVLFELHGSTRVRELEYQVLRRMLDGPAVILEVGGGVVMNESSFALLLEKSRTVWLRALPKSHWDRVVAQGDTRPMAHRDRARAELEALYSARAPHYARAEIVVDTERGVDRAEAQILARLAAP